MPSGKARPTASERAGRRASSSRGRAGRRGGSSRVGTAPRGEGAEAARWRRLAEVFYQRADADVILTPWRGICQLLRGVTEHEPAVRRLEMFGRLYGHPFDGWIIVPGTAEWTPREADQARGMICEMLALEAADEHRALRAIRAARRREARLAEGAR